MFVLHKVTAKGGSEAGTGAAEKFLSKHLDQNGHKEPPPWVPSWTGHCLASVRPWFKHLPSWDAGNRVYHHTHICTVGATSGHHRTTVQPTRSNRSPLPSTSWLDSLWPNAGGTFCMPIRGLEELLNSLTDFAELPTIAVEHVLPGKLQKAQMCMSPDPSAASRGLDTDPFGCAAFNLDGTQLYQNGSNLSVNPSWLRHLYSHPTLGSQHCRLLITGLYAKSDVITLDICS